MTEKEMLTWLRKDKIFLPPLSFRFLEKIPEREKKPGLDALIEASWGRKLVRFAVEIKSFSTPKVFQDAMNRLKSAALPPGCLPMLLLPFLNEKQLQELELEGISGIDLCGNGVVIAPGKFSVFRSGNPNRFPSSAPIKNIYRKNSSMVGRAFLSCPNFTSVQDIRALTNQKNLLVRRWNKKPMSLSTVSKALKSLEADLIVTREGSIRLLQPDKLLEKLNENYNPPAINDRILLKISLNGEPVWQWLSRQSKIKDLPIAASGKSSVSRYALMQHGDVLTVYCPRLDKLLERIPANQSDRFPNIEILETEDEPVYFDARQENCFWWSSPVQVYLELMAGDKRDRETAEQLKTLILRDTEL